MSSDSSSEEDIANVCLMEKSMNNSSTIEESEVCLKARDSLWSWDSGCSRHVMGDKSKLTLCQRKKDMSLLETTITKELWEKETLEISTRHK